MPHDRRTTPGRLASAVATACLVPATFAVHPAAGQEALDSRTAAAADGFVKIWGGDGSVRVVGWDRDSVSVTGTRRQGRGRYFHMVNGRTAKLGFEVSELRAGDVDADLEVRVPRGSSVWIRAAGAAIEVRDVEGSVHAFSVRGSVAVHGSPERVSVESMAGRISLDLAGSDAVRVDGGAGTVTVRGEAGDLTIETIEGAIDVEPGSPRRVSLGTIDGPIRYRGALAPGGAFKADTHTGDIELTLGADVSAAVTLSSVEGRVEADSPLAPPSRSTFAGSRRVGELGSGAGEIVVRSYLGDITLRVPASTR